MTEQDAQDLTSRTTRMVKNPNEGVNRLPRFTLRTFLLVVAILGMGLGLAMRMRQAKRQQEAAETLDYRGGRLGYNHGNITSIYFSSPSQLSDDNLEHLQALSHLETIYLHRTSVTDRGLSHLSKAPTLREVQINEHQISDVGIKNLSKLPKLEKVIVWGSGPETHVQMEKLDAALPDVEKYLRR